MVNPANHVVVMDDVDCISSFCVDPQKVCPSVIPQIHSVQTIDLKLHIVFDHYIREVFAVAVHSNGHQLMYLGLATDD